MTMTYPIGKSQRILAGLDASIARIYARLTGTVLPEELAITQR